MFHLLLSVAVHVPQWNDLISIDRKDGQGTLRIIDFIANHDDSQCDDFAHLLLNDRVAVQGLHVDNEKRKKFVRSVLETWFSAEGGPAVSRTWESLVKAMKDAGLDPVTVSIIEANVCRQH